MQMNFVQQRIYISVNQNHIWTVFSMLLISLLGETFPHPQDELNKMRLFMSLFDDLGFFFLNFYDNHSLKNSIYTFTSIISFAWIFLFNLVCLVAYPFF